MIPAHIPPLITARHAPKPEGVCAWFALCLNETRTTLPHPSLGDVPCCFSCADQVGLTHELEAVGFVMWGHNYGTRGNRWHEIESSEPFAVRAFCGVYIEDAITDVEPDWKSADPNPPRRCPACKRSKDAAEGVAS